ncbi:hypothetical protein ISN45_Aa05g001010 [Arabidopsis thaliana x Arabidopsis arenosa]|uniref:Uncharacterized protein n=1 Tax=Arabidopsis thaliana x Arabidopsis arenosa TaxID=1240361 RepID=A0A8T1ZJ57_9BRAS|nr:hypothetical protein ISN45_Aa05g001010 [Arabidopsis thaliana x Arabidopsis arenosa]
MSCCLDWLGRSCYERARKHEDQIGSGTQQRLARVYSRDQLGCPELSCSSTPRRYGSGVPNVSGYPEAIWLGCPQCGVRVPRGDMARVPRCLLRVNPRQWGSDGTR